MRPALLFLPIALILLGPIPHAISKPKGAAENNPGLRKLVEDSFARWDVDQNGKVDRREMTMQIRSAEVRGAEAVAVVVLRKMFGGIIEDNQPGGFSRAELLEAADAASRQKDFSQTLQRLNKSNRELFLPGDPSYETIAQNGFDCYLMSAFAAYAHRHPTHLKSMFKELPDGSVQVTFGSGKRATISPLTDAELVMGAKANRDHGIWANVLQKAYSGIRLEQKEQRSGQEIDPFQVTVKELLAGGDSGVVMSDLTGRRSDVFRPRNSYDTNPGQTVKKAHELLARLEAARRVMCALTPHGKSLGLPRGIVGAHFYAVISYDARTQRIKLFNPWNNNLKPKGEPGLTHGYPTKDGVFEMPVHEFCQVFAMLVYETDQPLKR